MRLRPLKPCSRCGGPKERAHRRRLCERCPPKTATQKTREYVAKNIETLRDRRRVYAVKNRDRLRAIRLKSHHRDPRRKLLALARARSRKNGLGFNLSIEDVTIPVACPVLGIPLVVGGGTGFQDASPTLDRVNNSMGYVRGNVLVVSWRANRIKCDATPHELRSLADFYNAWRAE